MDAPTVAPQESLSRDVPVEYKRVYIWNWPVRAMHWLGGALRGGAGRHGLLHRRRRTS